MRMSFLILFMSLVLVYKVVEGRDLTEVEYYRLPDLFHLDNYEQCLSDDEGVYCLGTFRVTPSAMPNPVYTMMKEYSEETYAFNHTLIHRGYCISSRCPSNGSVLSLFNSLYHMRHFEQCASEQMRKYSLKTNLTALNYCRTRADMQKVEMPSVPHILFLSVVMFLVVMNLIGTIYDVRTRDNPKQIKILMAWSAIRNWKILTKYDSNGRLPLTALHGIRVLVAISTCVLHTVILYYSLNLYKPQDMERAAGHPLSMLLQNGTGMEQMFIVISGFLYVVQLRFNSEKKQLNYCNLIVLVAKRIVRLSPVLFLVIGFAATWWPKLGSGPIWSATVCNESEICKEKFWTYLLFINNLVQPEKQCVLPTWYMAVDIQLHILSTLVFLMLLRYPKRVLQTLGVLYVLSCVLNAVLSWCFDLIPILYLAVSPENLRTLLRDSPSFNLLYITPWGNLPSRLLGLIFGHIYYDMKDCDIVLGRYKWILKLACLATVPVLGAWILLGYFIQHIKSKAFTVFYVVVERSVFQILVLMSYVAFSVTSCFMLKLLAWRGWHALSQLSLSVMTIHWIVIWYLVASISQPISHSAIDMGVLTAVYTFLIAIPVTVLVELPIRKVFDIILSKYNK